MSDLNTRATVTLQVNGQQAEQTLQHLKNNALQLESAIAKAAAAGNKTDLKRLRKELTDTKRQIREIESSTMQVEQVLSRLDRATPKELSRTLATLNKQLDYMERGSAAWNAHIEKIRMVKAEIAAVSNEVRVQEGFWARFNRTMNDWQTTIMGAAAAMTGLIMAGRSAVNAYAEMDEQMTNTQKYTGMTRRGVEELNDSFKKMDTRTSRDQLNELAQEAGRLGKTTKEEVQGYVEAADIINVALVDLGAGATQTIAKLSNIFGVEKMLGTRDAMLAVGSTVNVLSQNCTASKPYLVEFAQRMAGIGAQADMTIPEILAFGATLDANGQKTEMSSSALGKLIMMLNQRPEELSKAVGLNAEAMKELLKTDTTGAVIKFLEQIQKLGSKDGLAVLAPLFKDLGMDGVRMSQVLATLAEHLDMVKWELGEANKAFTEASSATNEYNLFNNTVQAGIDKAKKRLSELSIELGEKLLPIMKHVYSSSSMVLRLLSVIVDFVIKYRKEILIATTALVSYKVALNAVNIASKIHHGWILLTQTAHKVGTALMATYRTGVLMCSVAFNKLTGNIAKAEAAQKALNAAQKSNLFGIIASLAATAIVAFIQYRGEVDKTKKAEEALNEVRKEAAEKAQEEKVNIDLLREAAMNEKLSLDERQTAIDKLNKIIPDYNAFLDKTTGKYVENKEALDKYIESLIHMYEIEGAKDKLKAIGKQKADIKIEKAKADKEKVAADDNLASKQLSFDLRGAAISNKGFSTGMKALSQNNSNEGQALTEAKERVRVVQARIDNLNNQMDELIAKEKLITEVYGEDMQKAEVKATEASGNGDDTEDDVIVPSSDEQSSASKDKFEKEKEWKEREEALNRIAYATGQKNFEEYTARMNDISAEFYKKELEHTDLGETERLSIEAQYYEALKKIKDAADGKTLEEENRVYNEQVAQLKQRYIDGESTTEQYNNAMELAELAHLRRMVRLTKEGTAERLKAEKAYQDKLISNQQKRQAEAEKLAKEHQDALKKIKKDVFGMNPAERQAAYQADLALLQEVYNLELLAASENAKEKLRIEKQFQKAKLALMEQYNIEGAELNKNFLSEWNDDVMDFLNSDLGQAVSGTVDTLVSGMSSIFQQLTTIVQAELEIQQASINKRYDAEVSLAEGNNYKINKLEKQRQAELAKAKKESNKKMFAMQVIQAVAQTAQAAINAYSSAAAIPVAGWILAPIAAGMAVAAGALQIAAIKKQQQASEAQGYKSGGFTPDGAEDEVAGVVHAGEWVASQKLVNDPKTRPILEALDYAQRTNTIGSLSAEDVSSSITAPAVIAKSASLLNSVPQRIVVDNSVDNSSSNSTMKEVAEVIGSLKQRLDEPFITVNSVTGETGMKQAQDEYERLIRNKTPKSRR